MSTIAYPCGCMNRHDQDYGGAMRSVSKCNKHAALANTDREDLKGREYYEKCGTIGMEHQVDTPHVAELVDALGEQCVRISFGAEALEVGCGVSPYAAWLQSRGYNYFGIDTCGWAVSQMRAAGYDVSKIALYETHLDQTMAYDLVLAAHLLEHVHDALAELCEMRRHLKPGGRVVIVVPDDSDQLNPDHLWFFTQDTLRACMEYAKFSEVHITERQVVAHEKFIYATGVWRG